MTRPFDVQARGTSEAAWIAMTSARPALALPARRPLVVVTPHPDDESLGAGGLMATWARRADVVVVAVTDGEAALVDRPGLRRARRRELVAAADELGVRADRVVRLGLPDGAVDEAAVLTALRRRVPRGAWLVGPYERDGHPDHEATARACGRLARERGHVHLRYPIWAWHHAPVAELEALSLVRLPLSRHAREAKRRAVSRHRSQIHPHGAPAIVPPHVRARFARPYEVFVR